MAEAILKLEALSKRYYTIDAVKEVSLSIEEGEIFGLIGPNGAGKTTLFRMLLGLTLPTSGKIYVKGRDVTSLSHLGGTVSIGYLPEEIAFFGNLTGRETLSYFAKLKRVSQVQVSERLELVGLSEAANRRVREYSKGMRQRLGLAQALLGHPDIFFLDEPTSGLDPEGISSFYQIIEDAKDRGATVVITSHILKEVQHRVDRLGIIGGGRMLAYGSVNELRSSLELQSHMHVKFRGNGKELERAILAAGGTCAFPEPTSSQQVPTPVKPVAEQVEARPAGADLIGPGSLTAYFTEEHKMDVLRAVASYEDSEDVEIVEPSLEDVFTEYVCRVDK